MGTEDEEKGGGIFMSRGVSLRLSNLRFVFGPDGDVSMPPVTAEVSLNMSPFWLEIAMAHLQAAEQHHAALLAGKNDHSKFGPALEGEFIAGMQAIVAAATALDALYASVKRHIELPPGLPRLWQKKGTARYKQVAEVLRRAFKINPRTAVAWRRMLRDVYRLRDWAVHPSADFSAPVRHPDLATGAERRFIVFSFENARQALRIALAITAILSAKQDGLSKELAEACKGIWSLIAPVCKEWRARYGRLTDNEAVEKSGSDN